MGLGGLSLTICKVGLDLSVVGSMGWGTLALMLLIPYSWKVSLCLLL